MLQYSSSDIIVNFELKPQQVRMDDVEKVNLVKPYRKAPKPNPRSIGEWFSLVIAIIIDFVNFLILSFPAWGAVIKECVSPVTPKKIGGQVALVTGGGHGLGRELAIRLAKEGCNIIVFDIDGEAAKKTASDLSIFNVKAKGYTVDVTDYKAIRQMYHDIYDEFGSTDILVNNVGIFNPKISLSEGSWQEIERIISVNITSHIWMVRVYIEEMVRRRKGHIVAINSLCGCEPLTNVVYTTTKYAVRGFMECLSEMIRENLYEGDIITSTVYPTFVSTNKDLVEFLNVNGYTAKMAPLSPELAADEIVKGMLKNKSSIYVPWYHYYVFSILRNLPLKVKHLVTDIVLGKL